MHGIRSCKCLLGEAIRYNGGDIAATTTFSSNGAEGAGGLKVLAGIARVVDSNGGDVSAYLISDAKQALELARARHIRVAVLKEGSPSCGAGFIFDGTFTDTRVEDRGVTATTLQQAGVHAFM